jgi:hypothetical protein
MILWCSYKSYELFFKIKMYTIYKRKNQKIKFNDICVSNDFKSNDDISWKKNIIKKTDTWRISSINLLSFLFRNSLNWQKNAIKIWANSENADRKRIVEAKERTSFWNVVQSRDYILLRFHRKRFRSFWDFVAHKNSHCVAWSLTNFWISNFQSVNENNRRNDKKSN